MNFREYDSFFGVVFLFVFFCICFLILVIYSASISNIRKYQMLSGMVSAENQVMVLVSRKQLDWIHHNKVLLKDGKKVPFFVDRKVLVQEPSFSKKTYQVFLSISTKGDSLNSAVVLGFLEKKVSFMSMFLHMWGGD